MGLCEEMDEKYMDAINGAQRKRTWILVDSCGSPNVRRTQSGLPRSIAEKAAAQNLLGTAKLILELPESPAKIRAPWSPRRRYNHRSHLRVRSQRRATRNDESRRKATLRVR
jgi:hypothetical protein